MNDPFQTVHLFDGGKYQRTVRLYRHSISTNSPFSVIPAATFLVFLSAPTRARIIPSDFRSGECIIKHTINHFLHFRSDIHACCFHRWSGNDTEEEFSPIHPYQVEQMLRWTSDLSRTNGDNHYNSLQLFQPLPEVLA